MLKRFFLAIFAVALIGCGGGGAGGGGGPFSVVRVELPNGDPINIVVGQNVTFVLAGYDAITNQRSVLSADTWGNSNPAVGSISNSGQFTATNAGSSTISATWTGTPAAQSLNIVVKPTGLAGISGIVVQDVGGQGIRGQQVVFYNAANVEVGRANSLTGGAFTAYVTTDAVKMNMADSVLTSGGYLLQWKYGSLIFQAGNGIPNCHATFTLTNPPLVAGQTKSLFGSPRLYPNSSPPPFPSGCGP